MRMTKKAESARQNLNSVKVVAPAPKAIVAGKEAAAVETINTSSSNVKVKTGVGSHSAADPLV